MEWPPLLGHFSWNVHHSQSLAVSPDLRSNEEIHQVQHRHAHYLEFEGDQRQSHYPEKRIPENSQGKALFCVGDQGSEEKLGKKQTQVHPGMLQYRKKVKPLGLFFFNLFHFPAMVGIVWTTRRALAEEHIHSQSFFWMNDYLAADPTWIIPALACGLFYYNFGRGLNEQTKDTVIGKIKNAAQIGSILWFVLLCNWPSGITFYILMNAIVSVSQTTFMSSFYFMKKMNPKLFLSQLALRSKEYDIKQSTQLFEQVKTGEEGYLDEEIAEQDLIKEMTEMFKDLESGDIQKKIDTKYKLTFDRVKRF